ncbi:hypothetical protein PTSG_03930 [Salpingoeca rosetta]|uniref:PARP catalytic domain-containing protein n=1 Tax=Salpingoeca rosetta (strain ATCC 50818 / BSB-021) TaxID=946362 RepID=F2U7A5_SALR5|nr:uncharacterized protein PTSG_03930 [Salpingoeca rosetta]EGD83322.1 hypothetical protein PTSG_03930 [Salpingoeca rosetta]|eukprot:XP_004994826.1 hypothetical protein PTSG_03930 [Salpingoeca rosetta]
MSSNNIPAPSSALSAPSAPPPATTTAATMPVQQPHCDNHHQPEHAPACSSAPHAHCHEASSPLWEVDPWHRCKCEHNPTEPCSISGLKVMLNNELRCHVIDVPVQEHITRFFPPHLQVINMARVQNTHLRKAYKQRRQALLEQLEQQRAHRPAAGTEQTCSTSGSVTDSTSGTGAAVPSNNSNCNDKSDNNDDNSDDNQPMVLHPDLELRAFHCTSAPNINTVHAFGLRKECSRIGCFGRGIYTALEPNKANTYWRARTTQPGEIRFMLAVRVLPGRIFRVPDRTIFPPLIHSPPAGFDSVLGNVADGPELVAYSDEQVLIDYIIGYRDLREHQHQHQPQQHFQHQQHQQQQVPVPLPLAPSPTLPTAPTAAVLAAVAAAAATAQPQQQQQLLLQLHQLQQQRQHQQQQHQHQQQQQQPMAGSHQSSSPASITTPSAAQHQHQHQHQSRVLQLPAAVCAAPHGDLSARGADGLTANSDTPFLCQRHSNSEQENRTHHKHRATRTSIPAPKTTRSKARATTRAASSSKAQHGRRRHHRHRHHQRRISTALATRTTNTVVGHTTSSSS